LGPLIVIEEVARPIVNVKDTTKGCVPKAGDVNEESASKEEAETNVEKEGPEK
jgi:hypothetical protein